MENDFPGKRLQGDPEGDVPTGRRGGELRCPVESLKSIVEQ